MPFGVRICFLVKDDSKNHCYGWCMPVESGGSTTTVQIVNISGGLISVVSCGVDNWGAILSSCISIICLHCDIYNIPKELRHDRHTVSLLSDNITFRLKI